MLRAMEIAGYPFEFICKIEPLRSADGSVLVHMPQDRYKARQIVPLNAYGGGPFCKFKIPNNLAKSGVYVLTTGEDVRYVGECANLSSRFNMGYGNISPRNCYKGGQETNCRINNLICDAALRAELLGLWFFATQDHKAMETALRAALRSTWNRI